MSFRSGLAAAALLAVIPGHRAFNAGIAVTYVANMGVLVEGGECRVLIDALFRDGVPGYDYASPSVESRRLMERAQPPFAGIDLVLITHRHLDHFDSNAVAMHLIANPAAEVIATPQVVQRLLAVSPDSQALRSRVHTLLPAERRPVVITAACGASVEIFNLHHGRTASAENLGFRVTLGGRSVFHNGDSQTTPAEMRAMGLDEGRVDIGLLHYAYLVTPELKPAVADVLRPAALVALHIPRPTARSSYAESRGGWSKVLAELRAEFPGVRIPERELERWVF